MLRHILARPRPFFSWSLQQAFISRQASPLLSAAGADDSTDKGVSVTTADVKKPKKKRRQKSKTTAAASSVSKEPPAPRAEDVLVKSDKPLKRGDGRKLRDTLVAALQEKPPSSDAAASSVSKESPAPRAEDVLVKSDKPLAHGGGRKLRDTLFAALQEKPPSGATAAATEKESLEQLLSGLTSSSTKAERPSSDATPKKISVPQAPKKPSHKSKAAAPPAKATAAEETLVKDVVKQFSKKNVEGQRMRDQLLNSLLSIRDVRGPPASSGDAAAAADDVDAADATPPVEAAADFGHISASELLNSFGAFAKKQPHSNAATRRQKQGSKEQRQSGSRQSNAEIMYGGKWNQVELPADHWAQEHALADAAQAQLNAGPALGVFHAERVTKWAAADEATPGYDNALWSRFQEEDERQLHLLPARNQFEQWMQWTAEGMMWRYPIDNEQDWHERDVPFEDHVFLAEHLADFPSEGPLRQFMELICAGLAENPWISVQEKVAHIDWFRQYFEDKIGIIDEAVAESKRLAVLEASETAAFEQRSLEEAKRVAASGGL